MGGITIGRSVFDDCWQNSLPNVTQTTTPGVSAAAPYGTLPRTGGYCTIKSDLWDGVGSQIKLQAVYPLPYDFVLGASYKNLRAFPGGDLMRAT